MSKYNYYLLPIVPGQTATTCPSGDFRTSSLYGTHIPAYSFERGQPSVVDDAFDGYKLVKNKEHDIAKKRIGIDAAAQMIASVPPHIQLIVNPDTADFHFARPNEIKDPFVNVAVRGDRGVLAATEYMEAVTELRGRNTEYYKAWIADKKALAPKTQVNLGGGRTSLGTGQPAQGDPYNDDVYDGWLSSNFGGRGVGVSDAKRSGPKKLALAFSPAANDAADKADGPLPYRLTSEQGDNGMPITRTPWYGVANPQWKVIHSQGKFTP